MSDIAIGSGYALTAGQKNVDAAELNALVTQAVVQPQFVESAMAEVEDIAEAIKEL